MEHRYWEAWKKRDARTLAQIRAEDFREADHDGVWDKKQTEQGDLDLETTAFTMSNEKVSVLQPGVALLTYEVEYKASYKGKGISSSHSYIASLYERRKADWQLVYTQESLANDSQAVMEKEAPEQVVQVEKDLLNTYIRLPPIAVHYPLTSASKPLPQTLCCWPKLKLLLLTTLVSHSQARRILESPKQNR